MKIIDLSGQRFGSLTVIKRAENDKHGRAKWECRCDCGSVKAYPSQNIRTGHTVSCGCRIANGVVQREEHGLRGSRAYSTWKSMKSRCTNTSFPEYHRYGGRGIKVCDRWLNSFTAFYEDMGERPKGASLDRINNNGDYCPDNCRWATPTEQANNTRRNRLITIDGETLSLAEWARKLGKNARTIQSRIRSGWDETDAVIK